MAALAALTPETEMAARAMGASAIVLPIAFERARVEASQAEGFVARGQGYRLWLGPNGFDIGLIVPEGPGAAPGSVARPAVARLHATLAGVHSTCQPESIGVAPGVANYFQGNEPGKWRTAVPTFEKVQYTGVYPGVDLLFYGNQTSLEYDFIVGPGSDPAQIQLEFEGADDAQIDAQGALVLRCGGGEFRHGHPVLYQMRNGTRIPVKGEFILKERRAGLPALGDREDERGLLRRTSERVFEVTFEVGQYDATAPLWIDPVLDYGTFLGGSGPDSGQGVAVDANGNMYITGQTLSIDFPTTVGAYDIKCGTDGLCNGGHYDVFLTKLNSAGTLMLYSTYLGGSEDEQSWGVAVDDAGRAHVMGWTTSTNFPVLNAFQPTNAGSRDAFVASFDSNGGLMYSTYLGGSSDMDADIAGGIAVDHQGKIYVVGRTASPDFPVHNAFQNPGAGGLMAFIAKIDPLASGSATLLYSSCLGGSNGDNGGNGIAVDSAGYAYISGYTTANNLPVKSAAQPLFGGVRDSFAAKFDPTQNGAASLIYATYLGGSNEEAETSGGIAVDNQGEAWVTGATRSGTDFPLVHPVQGYGGDWDAFVTKLSASGSTILFSTFLGGSGEDAQTEAHITTDPYGNAYVTGQTVSSDFPVTRGTVPGGDSVYVAKFDAAGGRLSYSLILGPGEGRAVAADSARDVYVTGQTSSSGFPTLNALQPLLNGPSDAFLVKLRPSVNDVALQVTPALNTVAVGQSLFYLVTATNSGPDFASVVVTNLSSVAFANFPADCFYRGTGTEVDSPLLQLAPHASRTLLLGVQPASVGSLSFHAALNPDDGETNAANNVASATVSVVAAGTAPAPNALRLSDWDYVGLRYDTGEIVAQTQLGILGSPMGTLAGAVNLMLTNGSRPLYFVQGPSGDGAVCFGFINKTNWMPANRDGTDLPDLYADRVYAEVDGLGNVSLISAAAFTPGLVIATNQVLLSPNKPFRLIIDPQVDVATVYYGGQTAAQGNPFAGANSASRVAVGNDFAVSILGGSGDLSYTILNDRPVMSLVSITSVRVSSPNQLRISFQDTGSGATGYTLLSASTTSGPWSPVPGVTITAAGSGLFQAALARPPASPVFYRLQLGF